MVPVRAGQRAALCKLGETRMGTMGLLASLTVVGFGFLIKTTGLPLLVSSAVVEWLGFSVVGPVAGSIAAAAQSFAGNIASGSIFSSLQSFAMAV